MIAKSIQKGAIIATVLAVVFASYAYVLSSQKAVAVDVNAKANSNEASTNSYQVRPLVSVLDFSEIVDKAGPAVVNISVIGKAQKQGNPFGDLDENDPFFEFFRRFGPGLGIPRGQGREAPAPRGQGSGFIISEDGLILTNAHVVKDSSELTVRMTDRREFKAKLIGLDKQTDVAVLRITGNNLPTVKFGNVNNVKVGEPVLAIGSPFGFENSATSGIVSAKSRSLPDETFVPFIQTDVAVNPGNSGGPLFNSRGEVIGINAQIYSRTGGYQGLSFAIPIDVAVKVKDQILKHGKVTRGRIGVSIQEVNQKLAESFGLDKPKGALVTSVETGAPADKAGIISGDIIISVNNKEINRSSELPALIGEIPPGEQAKIEVIREGKRKTFALSVSERKEEGEEASSGANKKDKKSNSNDRLGLSLRSLSGEEQRQIKGSGLLVEDVSGPAQQAGIQVGDVILAVNGNKVANLEQFNKHASKAGNKMALLILRGGNQIFVPIIIE